MGDKFVCIGQKPTRSAPTGDVVGTTAEQTLTNKTLGTGTAVRNAGITQNLRTRVATADVNSGETLLAALSGYKYRMVDCILIAVGGNAETATGVQIKAGDTVLIDAAIAALTDSTVARAGDTNVAVLDDGASFVAQADDTAITIVKDGSDLATATNIDVILTYAIEAA